MKLNEAIQTGKPFKRLGDTLWKPPLNGKASQFTYQDILADDYEVRNEKVEVNYLKVHDAWKKAHVETLTNENRMDIFMAEIGLR